MSRNRVIGNDNKLPWYIPNDLKRFKQLTENNIVVMGGNTFRSLPGSLPNRINLVLSHHIESKPDNNLYTFNNQEELLNYARNIIGRDIYIIGGSAIYNLYEPFIDKIDLTVIDKDYSGDSFFSIDMSRYNLRECLYIRDNIDRRILQYEKKAVFRYGNEEFS